LLEHGMLQFALLGASWVLWVLVALSVACIAVALERAIYLLRDSTDRHRLQAAMDEYLRGGDTGALAGKISSLAGFEVRILNAGLEASADGPVAAEHAMSGVAIAERMRMERGLALLATTGANAPFVGLFGTVLGIIKAFHDLALDTSQGSEAVMGGISEALVATAVGLMVAIPAVVLYNLFTRWVRSRLNRSESLTQLLLARLVAPSAPEGALQPAVPVSHRGGAHG
jgi:biopolymer transport protein ExbB